MTASTSAPRRSRRPLAVSAASLLLAALVAAFAPPTAAQPAAGSLDEPNVMARKAPAFTMTKPLTRVVQERRRHARTTSRPTPSASTSTTPGTSVVASASRSPGQARSPAVVVPATRSVRTVSSRSTRSSSCSAVAPTTLVAAGGQQLARDLLDRLVGRALAGP